MRIGQIRVEIEDKPDTEEMVYVSYDINEANEHIENNLFYGALDSKSKYLTNDEWLTVVERMNDDDGVWQEFNTAFIYHVEQIVKNREKGKINDDSK